MVATKVMKVSQARAPVGQPQAQRLAPAVGGVDGVVLGALPYLVRGVTLVWLYPAAGVLVGGSTHRLAELEDHIAAADAEIGKLRRVLERGAIDHPRCKRQGRWQLVYRLWRTRDWKLCLTYPPVTRLPQSGAMHS